MTTGHMGHGRSRIQRGHKKARSKGKDVPRLGSKLARHVVAIARSRVVAAPLDPKILDEANLDSVEPEKSEGSSDMYDDTIRESIRRRWRSERPFEGVTTESIKRKLVVHALTEAATKKAQQELERRGFK